MALTRTTITAIRLLMHVAKSDSSEPVVLSEAAEWLEVSPSYLSKVARLLVRAGTLRASRGVGGGVVMNRSPADVTFLSIVEACQGAVLPDFCQGGLDLRQTCAFHQAAAQLHQSVIEVLTRWTLADLLRRPGPNGAPLPGHSCWIQIRPKGRPVRAKGAVK